MSAQAIMTLVLFLAVIVLLIWQPVSPIVIGAGIPVILAVFNVVEPSKAFSQFSNTTVIFFMSLLVVGGAIFKMTRVLLRSLLSEEEDIHRNL